MYAMQNWIYIDQTAGVIAGFIGLLTLVVLRFSWLYFQGDTRRYPVIVQMMLLSLCVLCFVAANHFVLLFLAWLCANLLLIRLMIHHPSWSASKASGMKLLRLIGLAALMLATGLSLQTYATGAVTVTELVKIPLQSTLSLVGIVLIVMTSFVQSALWPFHRWLMSSLNAPTPVSAYMHAGLINGGGMLLIKFSTLLITLPSLMTFIFTMGVISGMMGTAFNLIQTDVKRMLASSTICQMGFMFIQLGLGLWPAAIAHFICHGLFKSYLFLSIGDLKSRAPRTRITPTVGQLAFSSLCALVAVGTFLSFTQLTLDVTNGSFMFLLGLAVSVIQIALISNRQYGALMTLIIAAGFALAYGSILMVIYNLVGDDMIEQGVSLHLWHIIAVCPLLLAWLHQLGLFDSFKTIRKLDDRFYVWVLNRSQPYRDTITTHRQHYHTGG